MEDATLLYSISTDLMTDRIQEPYTTLPISQFFIFYVFPYRAVMSKYDLAFHEQFWQESHEFASRPIYEDFHEYRKWLENIVNKPAGFISAMGAYSDYGLYSIRVNFGEAHHRLTGLALAASAYYAKNNRYPSLISCAVTHTL